MEPLSVWEGHTAAELAERWRLPEVQLFRRVSSTNDVARRLAAAGHPAGACVVAEEQLAGRGRAGRSWASPAELGIWMSLVLRPPEVTDPQILPLVAGLAATRALDAFCEPLTAQLKWPNDLMLRERKLGGILCESAWEGGRRSFVIVGIGVNVRHRASDFPAELRTSATSLWLELGEERARVEIAGALASTVRHACESAVDADALLRDLEPRDMLRGHSVRVVQPDGGEFFGVAIRIERDGSLAVRLGDGAVRRVRSGSVRPAAGPGSAAEAQSPLPTPPGSAPAAAREHVDR